jgi:hypothetical protein
MSNAINTVLRGTTAVVGIGQTPFYKRGTCGQAALKLALQAIVSACEDAGIDPADIDGFVSYGAERNDGQRMMPALNTKELRFGALVWTHGGGIPGALGLAATAIVTGQANVVAVYRAMSETGGQRLRVAVAQDDTAAQQLVNGLDGPAQICAMRSMRLIEAEGVPARTLRDMALASYYHARRNPAAVGRGIELDESKYGSSRWISEPYRLFDCSRENDAGTLVSWAVVHRAPLPVLAASVPYVSAIVELAEGPWLMVRLLVEDPARLRVGDPVRVRYLRSGQGEQESEEEGEVVPVFEPA